MYSHNILIIILISYLGWGVSQWVSAAINKEVYKSKAWEFVNLCCSCPFRYNFLLKWPVECFFCCPLVVYFGYRQYCFILCLAWLQLICKSYCFSNLLTFKSLMHGLCSHWAYMYAIIFFVLRGSVEAITLLEESYIGVSRCILCNLMAHFKMYCTCIKFSIMQR